MKGSVTAVCTTVIKTCGYAVVVLYYVDLNYLKLHLRNVFFFLLRFRNETVEACANTTIRYVIIDTPYLYI